MYSSRTFIRTSGLITKLKKSALINDYENIIAYSEEFNQREVYANKSGLFQIHLGSLGISATSGKISLLLFSFKLGNIIPST